MKAEKITEIKLLANDMINEMIKDGSFTKIKVDNTKELSNGKTEITIEIPEVRTKNKTIIRHIDKLTKEEQFFLDDEFEKQQDDLIKKTVRKQEMQSISRRWE